ncbi:MAG: ABC transporter ATP-binding protein [Clostridiales bacterium]|nr:ABC transporter ATP-binding protein [Clostridiales bacterium]
MIDMTDMVKRYTLGGETIYALNHISLHVDAGEYVAIIGPSGSGKSTLMNIIGCLDLADSGDYVLNGKPIQKYRERQLARIRNKQIGFIFQGFNLLPKLTALENVELPMIYQGMGAGTRKKMAKEALTRVGLGERTKHRPTQLSGGQQQRCAIARAIAVKPALILADEPTGNLDKKTGKEILEIFRELHDAGNTIVLITHDPKVAQAADRIIRIEDGHLYENQEAEDDDLPIA